MENTKKKQTKVFVMCGPAGSGKSTWLIKQMKPKTDVCISRDNIRFGLLKEGEDYFAHENDVKEICTNNEDLFALSDALMQMQFDTALLEYKKLLDKDHPIKILATLQTMVRKWVTLKANSSKMNSFELSRTTGMNEYVIKLTLQKMKNTKLQELVKLKENLTNCEYKIKSGQALDVEREVANAFFIR